MNTLNPYTSTNWLPKKNGNPAYMEHINDLIKKINEIITEDATDNASLSGDNTFAGSNTFTENIQFAAGAYGVTALAGGGQAGATPLTGMFSSIAVCATNGDSCILPAAVAGNFMIVATSEVVAGTPQIYPAVGEQIDTMGANVPLTVTSGTVVMFSCDTDGNWVTTALYDINHIYNALNAVEADAVAPISVTYSDLKTLITTSALEVGRKYLITDYATAYNIFDGGTNTVIEAKVGTSEPLIVTAIGVDTLAKEAYSSTYPDDIIYYNPYAKAVDLAAFIAAGDVGYIDGGDVIPNFKGVIEFRHDTKQNVSTWYDFRNVKFRRWAVDAVAYDDGTAYNPQDVCKSGVDGKIYKCITATTGEGDPTVNTADWILWLDIVSDAYVSWTSDNTKFSIGNITTTNLVFVPATYEDVYTFGDWYSWVKNVEIGKVDLYYVNSDYSYNSSLNNMVFKTEDDYDTCHDNRFEANGILSTIRDTFYDNVFGVLFNNNILGSSANNRVNDYFEHNSIDGGFSYNTIGNSFSRNTIGNEFSYNTIGNEFDSNTIGNEFLLNTIGNEFSSNTIGDDFRYNTIGNHFSSNTIGDDFRYNTIGNEFYRSNIGDSFSNNFIGNSSKVLAGIGCKGNSIGDFNDQVTLGNDCTGISVGEKNVTITLGVANTNISIGNGNPAIITGDNCTNLTFQNGCTFSGNTAVNGLQNCLFESGTSITAVNFTYATHIKAAYNTTVFMDAATAVNLRYFDNRHELTVNDVNA